MKRFIIVTLTAGVLVGVLAPPSSASWVSDHCFVNNSADTAITRSTARTYAEVAAKEGYEWGGGCWNDNWDIDNSNSPTARRKAANATSTP